MNTTKNPQKSKFDKLFNVFEQFHTSLEGFPVERVSDLRKSWEYAKTEYTRLLSAGVSKSRIAAGLEQGLRELPSLFEGITPQDRIHIAATLSKAIHDIYPEFAAKEAKDLAEILAKNKIRGERQFYLVRHRIDELEGNGADHAEIETLYRLIDQFEARHGR